MEAIKESDFRRQIKSSPPASGYLFFGEEDYLKTHAQKLLRGIICSGEGDEGFNNIQLCSPDFTAQKLLDAIAPLPMFGERKLVEVTGLDFGAMKEDEFKDLCDVLAVLDDYDYSTVIISVPNGGIEEGKKEKGKWKPSRTVGMLSEYLIPVHFERCTDSQLSAWTQKHFGHNSLVAAPALCRRLVDYCGRDMYTLAGEIDKVSAYTLAHGRGEVSEEDIISAAIPAGDYDAFAFANAITARDRRAALAVLELMIRRRIDPVVIMGEVSRIFCDLTAVKSLSDEGLGAVSIAATLKIHEYRVGLYLAAVANAPVSYLSKILTLCAEADVALKLSGRDYSAVERLICSI